MKYLTRLPFGLSHIGEHKSNGNKILNQQAIDNSFAFALTPRISESCIEIKIKLNLYFHTSLWCLKKFYKGLKGLHKTF